MSDRAIALTDRGLLVAYSRRLADAWEGLSPAQRRAILGTLRLVVDTFAPRGRPSA